MRELLRAVSNELDREIQGTDDESRKEFLLMRLERVLKEITLFNE